jgi:hypothetical protein
MVLVRFARCSLAVIALLALAWAPLPAAVFPGLSIKILDESAPPGGIAQMKMMITEPKPISTGRGGFSYDGFDSVDGIALISPNDDTFGVARVLARDIELAIVSTSATYGTTLDYPVLTIAGHIPETTPLGSSFLFTLDSTSFAFLDPAGAQYPMEIAPGRLTIADTISIDDVRPGSADLPAGAVVQIFGTNFTPKTDIRFSEAKIASRQFVSPRQIDVVLGSPARMHGMRVRAKGAKETVEYFSYQRTAREGESVDPAFLSLVPVFPRGSTTSATIDLSGDVAGLGMQNLGPDTVVVTADLLNADGSVLASASFPLGSNRYLARSIPEVFQVSYGPGLRVQVSASAPIQAMGIAVDARGFATPIVAR